MLSVEVDCEESSTWVGWMVLVEGEACDLRAMALEAGHTEPAWVSRVPGGWWVAWESGCHQPCAPCSPLLPVLLLPASRMAAVLACLKARRVCSQAWKIPAATVVRMTPPRKRMGSAVTRAVARRRRPLSSRCRWVSEWPASGFSSLDEGGQDRKSPPGLRLSGGLTPHCFLPSFLGNPKAHIRPPMHLWGHLGPRGTIGESWSALRSWGLLFNHSYVPCS